jgi:hypothetical protein
MYGVESGAFDIEYACDLSYIMNDYSISIFNLYAFNLYVSYVYMYVYTYIHLHSDIYVSCFVHIWAGGGYEGFVRRMALPFAPVEHGHKTAVQLSRALPFL